jgi:signal transduction histidine kinase
VRADGGQRDARTAAQYVIGALASEEERPQAGWKVWLSVALGLASATVFITSLSRQVGPPPPISLVAGLAIASTVLLRPRAALAVLVGCVSGVFVSDVFIEGSATGASVWHAVMIAVESWLASVLVRRGVSHPTWLLDSVSIAKFLALIGVVACGVSALFGATLPVTLGLHPGDDLPLLVLTCWSRHALGAFICVPVVFALVAHPRVCWEPRRLRVAVPLGLLGVLVAGVGLREHAMVRERFEDTLSDIAVRHGLELATVVDNAAEAVRGLGAYVRWSDDVAADEFEPFTEGLLSRHPALGGMFWAAPTPDGDHVIVLYAAPEVRRDAIGMDLAVRPAIRRAIDDAASRGLVLSERIPVTWRPTDAYVLAAWVPGSDAMTTRGWALAVMPIERLAKVLGTTSQADICVDQLTLDGAPCAAPGTHARFEIEVLDQTWSVVARENPGSLDRMSALALVRIESSGALLGMFVAWLLLSLSGRNIALQLENGARLRAEREADDLARALERVNGDLEAANLGLEDANAELEQFAYMASHDLRAPLRTIRTMSDWIAEESRAVLSGDSLHHLEMLRSRVARMETMIEGLLEFSRAGRRNNHVEPIDTTELVRDVVGLHDDGAIELDLAPLPRIIGHRAPLFQVFANLIGNATKHSDLPRTRVTIRGFRHDDVVEFSVLDDGPGIEPRYAEQIFEPFKTLRSRDEVEGSGMGLATVRRHVEAEGGRIEVIPRRGRGAEFRFTWPATR